MRETLELGAGRFLMKPITLQGLGVAVKGGINTQMRNLFAYGTLMCDEIMREVSGYSLSHWQGTLKGYRRRSIRGEHYPAILPDAEGRVDGLVYRNVPDPAWDLLDRFEGEMYVRRLVHVELAGGETVAASAYVIREEFADRLARSDWDFSIFLRNGKEHFQNHYRGYHSLSSNSAKGIEPGG